MRKKTPVASIYVEISVVVVNHDLWSVMSKSILGRGLRK